MRIQICAYLDTHYYGGVKKYQWVAIPLAMHGVIVKKDGSVVEVNIGEDEEDPILYITDLLIHLAGQQMAKKASEVIEGEKAGHPYRKPAVEGSSRMTRRKKQ